MKKIILFLICLYSGFVQADISKSTLFSLNTIYLDRDYNDNGAIYQDKITDTDLRLMRIEKNWGYGVNYSLSSNDSSDANRTSIGLSVGFYSEKDFYLNYTYFYTSRYSFSGGEYKGTGYEFDLGFISKVTASFYAGLMFAIKSFNYTESISGGASSSSNATQKEVLPMFTFAVVFM
jgi:hypothetical protein